MISIADLVKRWGSTRHFIWNKCKNGEIPATKIGDKWFISMTYVEEFEKDMKSKVDDWYKGQFQNAAR